MFQSRKMTRIAIVIAGEHIRGPGGRIAERLLELWKAAARWTANVRVAAEGAAAQRDIRAVWRKMEGRIVEAMIVGCGRTKRCFWLFN